SVSVTTTSAMFREGRPAVPAKITSSISPPRRPRALLSPMAQRSASTMLDLPRQCGPTIPVSPGRMSPAVRAARLLNPVMRSLLKLTGKQPSHKSPLYVRDQFAERVEAHFAGVFCSVDHEARGRVDFPFVLISLLLLQNPGLEVVVADRLVESGSAHARQAGGFPQ